MVTYYDAILGLIPLSLGGISLALLGAGLSPTVAIPLASLVSIGLIGHAMFVRTPVAPTEATATAADAPGYSTAD
jgi:hypothetical protein